MKRYAVLVLMMVSAAALFANGSAEATDGGIPFRGREVGTALTGETVELTGTVAVVDGHPVLEADGETYVLGTPRAGWYADEIEEGMELTVEGVLQDHPEGPTTVAGTSGHIVVTAASTNGEPLELDLARPGFARERPDSASRAADRGRRVADDEVARGPMVQVQDDDPSAGRRGPAGSRGPSRGRRG